MAATVFNPDVIKNIENNYFSVESDTAEGAHTSVASVCFNVAEMTLMHHQTCLIQRQC